MQTVRTILTGLTEAIVLALGAAILLLAASSLVFQ